MQLQNTKFYKKGQDVNLLFVVVITLIIAIVIVAGFKAVKELNKSVQNMDIATTEIKNQMQAVQDRYVSIFDIMFLFLFVSMFVILLASAFFIDTHPVFFIISLFVTIITAFVGGHLANSYSDFASNDNISAEANSFTIIPYIFNHFIEIIIIMGMIITIALFAKMRSSSN